jgi:P27 family predicted phage terminase small subunit
MKGRKPNLKAIAGGLATLAPPPSHLPKSARTEWNRVTSDLKARKLLTPSMFGLIAAYCTAQWQIRECVKAIERDGAFVKTKNGEPKPHPAHGLMNKAGEIVARLGAELGLSPAARARKGLSGEAEKPDDGAPPGLDL